MERRFQKTLLDEGLHESHELFEPDAWKSFDKIAYNAIGENVTIQYMARLNGKLVINDLPHTNTTSHSLTDYDVRDLILLLENDDVRTALSLLRSKR